MTVKLAVGPPLEPQKQHMFVLAPLAFIAAPRGGHC